MGVFSGLKEASATKGGLYLQPGNYTVQVQRCKMQDAWQGNRKWFIVELRVMETDNENAKVGSEPSWMVELPGKYPSLALGNIKAFLHAAYSALAEADDTEAPDEDDIDEDAADDAVGEDNPLAGVFLNAAAFNKKTKEGNDFTRVKWSVPANLEELVG